MKRTFLFNAILIVAFNSVNAQQSANPKDTEAWTPVPKIVSFQNTPADAIILFNGGNLNQWLTVKDKSAAKWTVKDNIFTVNKGTGNIETKQSFLNYQLHIEWLIPANITGSGQARGNSGLSLA